MQRLRLLDKRIEALDPKIQLLYLDPKSAEARGDAAAEDLPIRLRTRGSQGSQGSVDLIVATFQQPRLICQLVTIQSIA